MCLGPSSGLVQTGKEQLNAYNTAVDQATLEFGDANKAYNTLMSSLVPIETAGPGQTGFSAPLESAINATTVDTTAAEYRNAATAVKEDIGAGGGGSVALPSGANIATELALSETAAQQESSLVRANTSADYAQGNANWQFATNGIEAAPGVFNSANAATTAATNAGSASATTQNDITAAQNSWATLATGVLGAVGGAAMPGGALANITKGASSTGAGASSTGA